MTTKQDNRNNMYRSVLNCVNNWGDVIATIPNFKENADILEQCVNEIHATGEVQRLDRSGIALEKSKVKKDLIVAAADYSGMILSFAKARGNNILLKEAKFTESDLDSISNVALLDFSGIVLRKAEENLEALKEYGITADTQKSLVELRAKFNSLIASPRTGVTQRSDATKALIGIFRKADAALENMDFAVNGVKRRLPEFYTSYRSARILVDLGKTRLALTAMVRGSEGKPLSGVVFKIKPENSVDGILKKKTAKTGGLHIKTLPTGNYEVTLSKPGYREKSMTVSVTEKERTEVIVEMEKA